MIAKTENHVKRMRFCGILNGGIVRSGQTEGKRGPPFVWVRAKRPPIAGANPERRIPPGPLPGEDLRRGRMTLAEVSDLHPISPAGRIILGFPEVITPNRVARV
jgi:hypothetical protein